MKLEVDDWEIVVDERVGQCVLTRYGDRVVVDKDDVRLMGYETFVVSTKALGVAIALLAGSGH